MQSAKVFDVSRGFIPVDPNSYPETLHAVGNEDYPEQRVPVVPYMGYNFLPTSRGAKSFFGTNSALNIASLSPNKADYIFLFQNLAYRNVLIALCDTGIWMKSTVDSGAWVNVVPLAAPADTTFYEWYYLTIKNDFYVYRANGAAFYKISTDVANPTSGTGVTVTTLVPTFITAIAQLGMFRLGGRIGFWDAQNAVAWSNADDFTDFTPAVLTGANVTTFNSILGKISAIRSQGTNAIVYASKSIVGLQIEAGQTFLAKAIPILQKSGVPYARQSCESSPDSTHYAYTTTGIFKIEGGVAEPIVPEVYDYFKSYTQAPVYLKLIQGRYLCFEILDPNALNGSPIFSTGVIAPSTITFPGSTSLQFIHDNPGTVDTCTAIGLVNDGKIAENIASATADLGGPATKGTIRQPIYTCHISNKGVKDVSQLTWSTNPCGTVGPNGTQFTMSPDVGATNKTGGLTTDLTNKTTSFGPDAWTDGLWTMERFVAYQTAIWKLEQKVLDKLIAAILARSFTETATLPNQAACVVSNPPPADCDLGLYNSKFSDPKFGFSKCSFWLTRYLIENKQIKNRTTTTVACPGVNTPLVLSGYKLIQNGNILPTVYPDPDSACAAWNYTAGSYHAKVANDVAGFGANYTAGVGWLSTYGTHQVVDASNNPVSTPGGGNGAIPFWAQAVQPANTATAVTIGGNITGGVLTLPVISQTSTTKVTTATAVNQVTATNTGILGVESAWCELTHWKVTAPNGTVSYVAASACTDYTDKTPGAITPGGTPAHTQPSSAPSSPLAADGSMCGIPYASPDLQAPVNWPDQTVVYPGATFLLQDGGIAPKYPDIYGFFCYDLHLKKWGKAKLTYKQLLDYSPINSESSSTVNFSNFGILAGVLKTDGLVYVFDDKPTDSRLTWGKFGFYRLGNTDLEEVRFDFASKSTGTLEVDVSLDGVAVVTPLKAVYAFNNAEQVNGYPPYAGKWFNLTLTGKFDVTYGEVRMIQKGRR